MLLLIIFFTVATVCYAQQPFPAMLPQVTIEETENGACPTADVSERARNATKLEIQDILQSMATPEHNTLPQCPCGGARDWTRIAYLDMSDSTQQCPANWTFITSPIRGCGRRSGGCNSAIFPANGRSYTHVCGKVIAYQRGSTDAFQYSLSGNLGLEGAYVDGVSITHGAAGSRQHIWSFASALYERDPRYETRFVCPCINTERSWPHQVPAFVKNNYFCDTGNPGPGYSFTSYYGADDPLWDGEGCGPTNSCCDFNNPPWFCTTLPQPTTDDLEIRICSNGRPSNEDTVISMVEVNIL